jgi:superfamily II DNA or RNA helicase
MSRPELRPYQLDTLDRLRRSYATGHRWPLLAAPTGSGKTVMFAEVVDGATSKGNPVLVVVHRRELIHQAAAKLTWAGLAHGIIAAGFDPDPTQPVQLGSVQTLVRRAGPPDVALLIFDEAHHARARSWQLLIERHPSAWRLGVTATPARLDGKGLGAQTGGPFDDLVLGPTTAELIAQGFLSPVRCFAPARRLDLSKVRVRHGDYAEDDLELVVNTDAITGDAVKEYRERADHAPAIVFCCTIHHAETVAGAFRTAGYRAAMVCGTTPKAERDTLIAGLGDGSIEVLTNCTLIDEGVDIPAVGAVSLLRPTKSLVLHRQQIGRGMRPAAGKSALIVNDHVGNVITHGLPEAEPVWTLAGVERSATAWNAPVWTCPECSALNPLSTRICTACSYQKPALPPRILPSPQAGVLAEVTAERLARARTMTYRQMLQSRLTEAELRAFAQANGYKSGWVFHRLREQAAGGDPW